MASQSRHGLNQQKLKTPGFRHIAALDGATKQTYANTPQGGPRSCLPLLPSPIATTYPHSRLAFLLPSLQPVKSSLSSQEQSLDIINIHRLLLWPNLNCSLASAFCIRYVPNVLSTMPVIVQDDGAHSCSLASQHHRVEGAGSS